MLGIDHYYTSTLTENGPRIGEMKLIFLEKKKKSVDKELFWNNINFFHHLELSFKTGVCLPEWDIFQRNLIDICF